jgi:V8-like Glu-specific endopeptidase
MTQSANVRLNGKQMRLLQEALLAAFGNYGNLEQLLLFELDEHLNQIVVVQAPFGLQVTQLIQWAEAQGKTRELILAARNEVPGNDHLRNAAETILGKAGITDLEKIVSSNPQIFHDGDAWRMEMIRAEWTVCRAEKPEAKALGTGFLVTPKWVLTNYHVAFDYGEFDQQPDAVRMRFGLRELADGKSEGGTPYALADDWLVHKSQTDTLDYALLRLASPAGEDPVGSYQNAPPRGRVKLAKTDAKASQGLFILQHPLGDTLKMANGGVRAVDGAWLSYEVDTEPGSSGSPVFNNKWELVALHSRAGKGKVNQGVAISAILDDLPQSVRDLLG